MDYEKKDFRKIYEDLVKSDWFKRAYHNKSLGECPFDIPELAESEDERIRKLLVWQVHRNIEDETNDLTRSVYDGIKGHHPDLEESIEDWKKCLAWLERQKEQKPEIRVKIPKFRVGDIIQHIPLEKWDRSRKIVSIDEHGYNVNLSHLDDTVSGGTIGFAFENEYELVEQNPERSEEDEKNLKSVVSTLWFALNTPHFPLNYERIIELETWLKSLSPSWKPSEEQIKAVAHAYNSFPNDCPTKSNLRLLYHDLEKLM